MDKQGTINVLKQADAVCLDVDSTVCEDEGIDALATYCGVGQQVKEWTNQAMGGSATFQESFEARLKIINPSCETVKKFLESHSPLLTPGVKEFVNLLRSKGCDVYLVSGGIMEIIEPVAALLDIPKENVFANRLKYFYSGEFAGFDKTCPTSRSGGKPVVVEKLKKQHGYQRLVMIGDGVTDMEACPPADAFIGFGVNVQRKAVKEKSKWFALSFQEIINVLKE